MAYEAHSEEIVKQMLKDIGLNKIDDLYSYISDDVKLNRELNIPDSYSELDILKDIETKGKKNKSFSDYPGFKGAGIYDHFIPTVIDYLVSRGEFLTAYTPYQPEASQGELQAIFEYQTAIARLCNLDISNSSLYDGGSAVAEAILMAYNQTNRNKILVSEAVHPEYIEVANTYIENSGINIEIIPLKNYQTDYDKLISQLDDKVAAVVIQNPNFFGSIEDFSNWSQKVTDNKSILIGVCYPISLGLINPLSNYGAEIIVGEGQSLGNPMGFGGPHFGFMACKQDFIRRLPGRIVGMTDDCNDKKGFCLTFQTREQHIRREKATSNICTNQALCSLRAIIYMSLAGENGFKEVAEQCYQKAHYCYDEICKNNKIKAVNNNPFFNEFLVELPNSADEINKKLSDKGIIGGLTVNKLYKTYSDKLMLIAVTEKRSKIEIDTFVKELNSII